MAMVRTRKRGKSYSYIFEAGKTAEGKRKVIEKGGFPTKEAAYEAGVAAFTSWKHGDIGITSERVTVKDFLMAWLERVRNDIRPTTYTMYRTNLRSNVLPFLGPILLQELTPSRLDHWLLELKAKNLSYDTIRLVKAIFSMALEFAVYPCQLIKENPCHHLKTPKTSGGRHVERVILSQDAIEKLLAEYPSGSDFYLPLVLLYHTGMRIGEVLGLCWEDIDFEHQALFIRRQRVRDRQTKGERLTLPKTKTSIRKLFLPGYLLDLLHEQQQLQEDREAAAGKSYFICSEDADGIVSVCSKNLPSPQNRIRLVCIRKDGKPVNRSSFGLMMKKHGLNSHSFRHTQATRLVADGLSPVDVAARLGHSTVQMTLGTYSHSTEDRQKEIADRLEEEYWMRFFEL